jgi:ribosomal protein S27AE
VIALIVGLVRRWRGLCPKCGSIVFEYHDPYVLRVCGERCGWKQ